MYNLGGLNQKIQENIKQKNTYVKILCFYDIHQELKLRTRSTHDRQYEIIHN
jgi:hypothetical protein